MKPIVKRPYMKRNARKMEEGLKPLYRRNVARKKCNLTTLHQKKVQETAKRQTVHRKNVMKIVRF